LGHVNLLYSCLQWDLQLELQSLLIHSTLLQPAEATWHTLCVSAMDALENHIKDRIKKAIPVKNTGVRFTLTLLLLPMKGTYTKNFLRLLDKA